jgi:hypothetical protein
MPYICVPVAVYPEYQTLYCNLLVTTPIEYFEYNGFALHRRPFLPKFGRYFENILILALA